LVGFASRFLFHPGSVELSLMIHPKLRNELMAKKLLLPLLKYIPSTYKQSIVIATAHQQKPDIYPEKNWEYLYSSYRLKWQGIAKKPHPNPELEIIKAQMSDFKDFQNIIYTCFPESTELGEDIYEKLINNSMVTIYFLKKADEFIGAIQINQENKWYRISDVAILPSYQQHGYGHYLLMNIIHQLHSRQKQICLDVENTNTFVLNWYQRLGMVPLNISDYWKIAFTEIF
jgi:ribosomal protein S18 acetylase RimI-like enzyme